MSETKFTKCPWEATQDRHLQLFVCDENNHDVEICEVLTHNGYDAHLISAAPDLYKALEACKNEIKAMSRAIGKGILTDKAIDLAEQALAKARGVTNTQT